MLADEWKKKKAIQCGYQNTIPRIAFADFRAIGYLALDAICNNLWNNI